MTNSARLVGFMSLLITCNTFATPVEFVAKYTDPQNVGFKSAFFGPAFKKDLETALGFWASRIHRRYVGEKIVVEARFSDLAEGILAEASPTVGKLSTINAGRNIFANTSYPVALFNHLKGSDQNGNESEIKIEFANNTNFFTGVAGKNPNELPRFVSTAAHEIAHGLGINSGVKANGDFNVAPTIYDKFLNLKSIDPAGGGDGAQDIFDPIVDMDAAARLEAVTSRNLVFKDGELVADIYSPLQFDSSSVSHLAGSHEGDLLVHDAKKSFHNVIKPSEIDVSMLSTIGWTVVPLPSAAWLFFSGLVAMVASGRLFRHGRDD